MTHKEHVFEFIEAWTKENGDETFISEGYVFYDDLLDFVGLLCKEVAKTEREACAKIAEELTCGVVDLTDYVPIKGQEIAAKIRARGQS